MQRAESVHCALYPVLYQFAAQAEGFFEGLEYETQH